MIDYDRVRALLNDQAKEIFKDEFIDVFMQIVIKKQNAQLALSTASLIAYSLGMNEEGDRFAKFGELVITKDDIKELTNVQN